MGELLMLNEICLRNLLSFGPKTEPLQLKKLNIFIGPNGSGKSNLIEAISLLQSAPKALASPVRDGGGIRDWLWKGQANSIATLDTVIENPDRKMPLRHVLSFTETAQRFELVDERIENESSYPGEQGPYFLYKYQQNRPVLKVSGEEKKLRREAVDPEQSILSQRKDPEHYPEITYLGSQYEKIRIYREWSFGRYTPPRRPQKADQRNDFLDENFENLGLVLNRLRREPVVKNRIIEGLRELYEGIDDFDVNVEGGTVQVFFTEGNFSIPATRLSDGTLRYLCLLAILCHPSPPPLICIEEPELGLHPDVLPALAKLLEEASNRTQLLITTHSADLVDKFSKNPESVVVCEKIDGQTHMNRLKEPELKEWLAKYSLGLLWRQGELGGNRW
jgi:predicted ATPase